MENELNLVEENSSILASIDELDAEDKSYDESICTYALEETWDGNYVHLNINTIDARLKIRHRIRQAQ